MIVDEKIQQAIDILREKDIDMWLTFVRELSTLPDQRADFIIGTGCTWPSAFIITAQGDTVAIVGSLDAANIKDHKHYREVISYLESIKEDLVKTFERFNPKRIAINYSKSDVMADGLSHGMYLLLVEYLENTPYLDGLVSSENILAALRGRKSNEEIARIKAAVDVTLKIFDKVTEYLQPGLTEREVAKFIKDEMAKCDLEPAWEASHCPAVFAGPESAGAHAEPTNRTIKRGHVLNIDFGVKLHDYVSDLQRTWYFLRQGEMEPPKEVVRAFDTVRESIDLAAQSLKPGVEGWIIDKVARDHIVKAGYEEFPHALGHQVGRSAHDGSALLCPKWERYKNLPYLKIEPNQVYTLEPRINIPKYGVATIEEIVVVREKRVEYLSEPQTEIICIK
jgi:Xaa-Pro aminopeptidase